MWIKLYEYILLIARQLKQDLLRKEGVLNFAMYLVLAFQQ
jgi:hypothetical protein